jgi:predicted transglutaminase-like protease
MMLVALVIWGLVAMAAKASITVKTVMVGVVEEDVYVIVLVLVLVIVTRSTIM